MTSAANQDEVVLLALGSNLESNAGDRAATLRSAVESLSAVQGVTIEVVSAFVETQAVGMGDAPPFLNAAVRLRCAISPRELLRQCLAIEHAHGRARDRGELEPKRPRTLDIDLLLFGQCVIDEEGLRVPHPRLHERLFVLTPAAEIAGMMRHPMTNRTIAEMLRAAQSRESG